MQCKFGQGSLNRGLIEGCDYFVHLVDFPVCSCGGCVMLNEDGTYTVLLNSRLSHQQNIDSMRHEYKHMEHDDFYRDISLEQKEREADCDDMP